MKRDRTEDRLKRYETAEQVTDEMREGGVKNALGNGLGHLGGGQGFLQDKESWERSRRLTYSSCLSLKKEP